MERLVIELTAKYNDGDMTAKVYQERTDNVVYFNFTAKAENLKKTWVMDWGRINNKKINKITNNELLSRMQAFFNANTDNIISEGVIFEK